MIYIQIIFSSVANVYRAPHLVAATSQGGGIARAAGSVAVPR